MVTHDVQDLEVKVSANEVVVAPLPPAFVRGLAEAGQELLWAWLHDHAPKGLTSMLWYASEFDRYSREAETHGGQVPADLAQDVTRDLPLMLQALEQEGGNLKMVALIGGGVA